VSKRIHVPTDPAVLREVAENFTASYGLPLIAGGETPAAAPPAAPPAAAPTVPAAPAPVAPAAPAAPAPAAEPGNAGAPAAPDFGQQLDNIVNRLDELAPPAPVDPLAVELGLVEPPTQTPPGQQPQVPGQQPQPTAGQPQPPQAPGQPGPGVTPPAGLQVNPNDPAQVAQLQAVEGFIEDRARQVAEQMLQEQVQPYLQQQESSRRRNEAAQVVADYPKFKDPAYANQVIQQARAWAGEVAGNEALANEPGFLEVVHLAMEGLAASHAAAPAAPGGQPGGGEVPIEGGGAAAPGAPLSDTQKKAQEIVAAKPGGGLNSLWI
jgi:hypothetical protein